MLTYLFLASLGLVFSFLAGLCVRGGCLVCSEGRPSVEEMDGKLFGKVPIHSIGIVGYILIAVAAANQMELALNFLVAGAALFTVFLMVRGYKIRLGCPFCYAVWVLNAVLVAVAFTS